MNYLAHIYLSGNDERIIVGNFIADYVKGKSYLKFPKEIQTGILMHRQIDTFTDSHFKSAEAKQLLRSEFGLYSGIIVDFFYDHFLASNWNKYSHESLRSFSKRTHAILLANFGVLPRRVQGFLPFLIQNRRLESYATIDGITDSIRIMSKYSSLPAKYEFAKDVLISHYDFYAEIFFVFMAEIIDFVSGSFNVNLPKPDFANGA